jgi:hypothetical protein
MKTTVALCLLCCGCAAIHKWTAPKTVQPPQPPSGLVQSSPPPPRAEMFAMPVLVSGNPALTLGWTISTATNISSQLLSYGVQSQVYTNNTQLPPSANRFQVTNLVWSTTYFFAVKCTDVNNLQSPYSTELMYTTTNVAPTPPPAPTNLKVISVP